MTLPQSVPRSTDRILLVTTLVAAVAFSSLAVMKVASVQYGFDTAVVSNVLWRLAHGHDSVSALTGYAHLADHPSIMLLLLVPVAAVAGPWLVQCLVVLQAMSVASIAWSVWRYARARGLGTVESTALYAVTLLGLGSWFAATGEFHLVDVALGPTAAVFANWELGNRRRALVWAVVAASSRVEMALAVVLLGLLLRGKGDRRPTELVGVGGAVGVAILLVGALAGPGGVSVAAHLGHLGPTPAEVLSTLVHRPVSVLEPLGSSIMWASLFIWLAAFGFLPVLGGFRWLLPAVPMLAIPILGSWRYADAYYEHYWHVLVVFGAIASVSGLLKLNLSAAGSAVLVVVPAALMWMMFGPLNANLPRDWRAVPMAPDGNLKILASRIGRDSAVSVPMALTAYLSLRQEVTFFPRPFSCTDTEEWLPSLGISESGVAPTEVISDSELLESDDPVWSALLGAYVEVEVSGTYGLWQVEDSEAAAAMMVTCETREPG